MKNVVDKYVDNGGINSGFYNTFLFNEDIHVLIYVFFLSFPRIFDRKRYKLIKFAPKMEFVDKYLSVR